MGSSELGLFMAPRSVICPEWLWLEDQSYFVDFYLKMLVV